MRPQPRGAAWRLTWRQPLRPPLRHNWRSLLTRLACAAWALAGSSAQASSDSSVAPFCGLPAAFTPVLTGPALGQQDRLLRLASAADRLLASEAPGHQLAVVARDGTALDTVGQRYSHAGLALRDHPAGPFTVRQLYHDCQRGAPALYDQGMAGFLLGARNPWLERGERLLGPIHLAILWLPADAQAPLAQAALDKRLASSMLHPAYSANAYPFSTRYQNCNQWLIELMALAWGAPAVTPGDRTAAQRWLRQQGFEGTVLDAPWWLHLGAPFMIALSPWMHSADRPASPAFPPGLPEDARPPFAPHPFHASSHLSFHPSPQGSFLPTAQTATALPDPSTPDLITSPSRPVQPAPGSAPSKPPIEAPAPDPDAMRRTVLPEGLMQWAQRQWAGRPGLRRVDLCITGGGALFLHEGGLLPQARCESGRPMAEGPSPGPHDGQG